MLRALGTWAHKAHVSLEDVPELRDLVEVPSADLDGVAQRVDVSIYECGVNSLATFLPLHYGGKETTRAGNRHPMAAPWNAFQRRRAGC